MKRILCLLALGCLLLYSSALGEYSPGTLVPTPREVLDHIARSFPTYELEDYCEICDTPKGDFGFALLTAGDERLLVGYEEKDGRMTYWLKSHGAVPQGSEEAWFSVSERGKEYINPRTDRMEVSDGLSFSVTRLDDAGESYEKGVSYRWQDGGFRLSSYGHETSISVFIEDGYLEFWDFGWWRKDGTVAGTVQTDIRYVSYHTLPATIQEARESITTAPRLEHDVLYSSPNIFVKEVKFAGGRNYPVYQGPGEEYGRAANGKASVSTNDWIQVFCRYNGYAMIQYDISAQLYRIGWIDEDALPEGADVDEVDLQLTGENDTALSYACALTDDPHNGQGQLAWLEQGTPVKEVIYNLYGWSYIRVTVDGKTLCGFVPSDAPIHG